MLHFYTQSITLMIKLLVGNWSQSNLIRTDNYILCIKGSFSLSLELKSRFHSTELLLMVDFGMIVIKTFPWMRTHITLLAAYEYCCKFDSVFFLCAWLYLCMIECHFMLLYIPWKCIQKMIISNKSACRSICGQFLNFLPLHPLADLHNCFMEYLTKGIFLVPLNA